MKVLLPRQLLSSLRLETDRIAGKYEIGGVLLGYRRNLDLEIKVATHPSEDDRSSKFRFERRSKHHQIVTTKLWKSSDKKVDWIGEWHTHPEKTPSPSLVDINSWRKLVKRHGSSMVFIILGYGDVWIGTLDIESQAPKQIFQREKSEEYFLYC